MPLLEMVIQSARNEMPTVVGRQIIPEMRNCAHKKGHKWKILLSVSAAFCGGSG